MKSITLLFLTAFCLLIAAAQYRVMMINSLDQNSDVAIQQNQAFQDGMFKGGTFFTDSLLFKTFFMDTQVSEQAPTKLSLSSKNKNVNRTIK